ncbi:hypothetical protein FB446DRAFT_791915 [Lentinula raphanica]|nr:hypothetical protein FB446DRAFT_791915 [Lentinula raphanica]
MSTAQGANEDPMDILQLLGPPTLSPEEQGEYNNAKFPATHKMAMILDLADPIQMPEWMRFCLTMFQAMNIPGPAGQVPVSTGQQQVTGQDVGGKIPAGQVTGMTRPGLVKTLIGNHKLHQVPNSKLVKRSVDDPYTFSEWKSAAEAVARQPPLESLYQTFTGMDGAVLNAETNSRGRIYISVVTPAAAKEETPDLTRFFAPDTRSSVKQEQAEDHERAFVENVDKLSLMLKEMGTLKTRFQDKLMSLQQLLNDVRAGKSDAGMRPQPRPGFSTVAPRIRINFVVDLTVRFDSMILELIHYF